MFLELKNIRLSFTSTHNETLSLLDGVNLSVAPGKITAIVGGNGAGKTTLFNIISGIEKGYSGEVLFEGNNLNKMSPHKISRMGIGRLFQGGQLLDGLTLMENMKIASDDETGERPFQSLINPHRVKKQEEQKEQRAIEIITSLFGPGNKYLGALDKNAASFSYGEQRLLSLARLLMGNNRLLLLDEPTSGVNPVYIGTIANLINDMVGKQNVTVLLIEHNIQFVRKLADTCAFLDNGVISKIGSTDEVLSDENVTNRYLGR